MILGQKIVSCVVRVKESFGAEYVAQVLTGSQEARIVDNGHDQLSTWGLLKSERKPQVRDWIEQLASQGYLERFGEYNTLRVTPAGRQLLKGEAVPRLLKAAARKEKASRATTREAASWEGVDSGLFEVLRKLRRQISTDHNVPPFVVFADTTLRDLARKRPTTLEGFRQSHGVGDKKTSDYGATFTAAIAEYCQSQHVASDVLQSTPGKSASRRDPEPSPRTASLSATRQAAFDLFQQGQSIEAVAASVGRASSTVREYLAEFISESGISEPTPWVDLATFERIRQVRHVAADGKLKPIFDALDGTVSYDILKIALACLQHVPPDE